MEAVEEQCASLARHGQFLEADGVEEWPDGTVTGRYAFLHALHQHVVYQRVPVGRSIQLHGRIGARLEAGYGERAGERAAELALHFAAGRDHARAVPYLQQAAASALRRWAYAEALGHLHDLPLGACHSLCEEPQVISSVPGAGMQRALRLDVWTVRPHARPTCVSP